MENVLYYIFHSFKSIKKNVREHFPWSKLYERSMSNLNVELS